MSADGTDGSTDGGRPTAAPWRRWAGVVLMVLVGAGLVWAVAKNASAFADTLQRLGVGGVLLSLVLGMLGIGATGLAWQAVLRGLGVDFGLRTVLRVYFVGQLGKYLPGSVWPIVMQMEAGRARGASRATVLAANLMTIVLGLASGLVAAAATLPFSYPGALSRYWWVLAASPLLVVLALPRTLPWLLGHALRLLRRAPLEARMDPRATLVAAAWSLLSWVLLGAHLAVIVATTGRTGPSTLVLAVGGLSLAVVAGLLFVPAPAGAGLREVVLGVVLGSVLDPTQVVVVVVGSRVVLLLADVVLGGIGALVGGRGSDTVTPASVKG